MPEGAGGMDRVGDWIGLGGLVRGDLECVSRRGESHGNTDMRVYSERLTCHASLTAGVQPSVSRGLSNFVVKLIILGPVMNTLRCRAS